MQADQVLQLHHVHEQASVNLVACPQQSPELLQAVLKAGVIFITLITGGFKKLRPLLRFQWSFPGHGRGTKSNCPRKKLTAQYVSPLIMIWLSSASRSAIPQACFLVKLGHTNAQAPVCFSPMLMSELCTDKAASELRVPFWGLIKHSILLGLTFHKFD